MIHMTYQDLIYSEINKKKKKKKKKNVICCSCDCRFNG